MPGHDYSTGERHLFALTLLPPGQRAFRHSRRNAMPMPMRRTGQTQRVSMRGITRRAESRNAMPEIRNSGPVMVQ